MTEAPTALTTSRFRLAAAGTKPLVSSGHSTDSVTGSIVSVSASGMPSTQSKSSVMSPSVALRASVAVTKTSAPPLPGLETFTS